MAWLNPAALAALGAVALPLVIHLLLRQKAPRLAFPSVRFLRRSDESAVRVRWPSDWLLLVLRMAIVACAALALAQPLWLTSARKDSWRARVVRAVVVDTSDSVDTAAAGDAAQAAAQGATVTKRFDSSAPQDSLERASAWLGGSQPGRREIVIVSDFQRGSFFQHHLDTIAAATGVRPVRVAAKPRSAAFSAGTILHGLTTFEQTVRLDPGQTVAFLRELRTSARGLELKADGVDPAALDRLLRVVASAGAVAPRADRPLLVRFGERVTSPSKVDLGDPAWEFARRLAASPVIQKSHGAVSRQGHTLVLDVAVRADSLEAAEVVQAALDAQQDDRAWQEWETESLPADVLSSWTREPGPPDESGWRRSPQSDGRWFWLLALLLLGLETVARRGRVQNLEARGARAA